MIPEPIQLQFEISVHYKSTDAIINLSRMIRRIFFISFFFVFIYIFSIIIIPLLVQLFQVSPTPGTAASAGGGDIVRTREGR